MVHRLAIGMGAAFLAVGLAFGCDASDEQKAGATASSGGSAGNSSNGGTSVGGMSAGGSSNGGTLVGGNPSGGAGPVVCDLGTIYPNLDLIDPDAPDFEDDDWTKQETIDALADAKAQNTKAYQAYSAAFSVGALLECAFCACGCEAEHLGGHLSAIDCFKDMHGFT